MFGVSGLAVGVSTSGFRVWGVVCGVPRAWGASGCGVHVFKVRVEGSGFRGRGGLRVEG